MKKCILRMFALLLVTMCVLPLWNMAQAASGKTVYILDSGVWIVLPAGTTLETNQARKATYSAPYGVFNVTVDITKWALKDSGDFAGYHIQYNDTDMYVEEKATNNCAVRFNGNSASYTINFLDLHGNARSLMYDVFGIGGPTDAPTDTPTDPPADPPTDTPDPGLADLEYTVYSDYVEITGYNGTASALKIPAEIEGKPVTSIGEFALTFCNSLWDITLPETVTSIGSQAFKGCRNLTSITLPQGLTTIGDYAFWSCERLESITIPDSVTEIGSGAFRSCESLTSITVPDSVTEIGYGTFYGCSSLKGVKMPTSVTKIGANAFHSCTNLTSITIPDSVTQMGYGAFQFCNSLTSISIPAGVTSIGQGCFAGCKNLKRIYFYGLDDITIEAEAIPSSATIYCYRSSAIASWAAENGYKVVYLDDVADDYDINDALLVMQHIAGWNVSPDLDHVDVNASDSVDIQDALLILRHLSGEAVELR